MPAGLKDIYNTLVASGGLAADSAQERTLEALQELCTRLVSLDKPQGWLRRSEKKPIRGLYLYGPVGRGKSMLMDMFYDHVPVADKKRVHFHQFMLDIHAALHEHRLLDQNGSDPLPQIAQAIIARHRLLCFDEFHVVDIADAMILARLFTALFAAGLVLVATSNDAPDKLYSGGLQRALFEPFIEVLKAHTDVMAVEGAIDHRLARLSGQKVYFTPLGEESSAQLAGIFETLTGGASPMPAVLDVQNRKVRIPRAAKGVAWCDFADLCGQALGAADYLALTRSYHSLILDGVPRLQPEQRNETVRFMKLVDVLYEAKVKLILAAAAMPAKLHPEGQHAQAFLRTASRLEEMRSADYLTQPLHAVTAA